MTRSVSGKAERQARERRGNLSEYLAAALMLAKGYRILARRFVTTNGEVDLIACRGRRLAFIEVKRRPTWQACEAAITPKQRQRIRRAAELWLARHARYRDCDIAFDLIFLTPSALPRHLPNAL